MFVITQIHPDIRYSVFAEALKQVSADDISHLIKELIMIDDAQTLEELIIHGNIPADLMIESEPMTHLAVKYHAQKCLEVLMETGASLEAQDSSGQNVTQVANSFGSAHLVL